MSLPPYVRATLPLMQAFTFRFRHDSWSSPIASQYRRELKMLPRITAEQAIALIDRATRGDTTARDELLLAHLPFVVTATKSYGSGPIPLSDLIPDGYRAADRNKEGPLGIPVIPMNRLLCS